MKRTILICLMLAGLLAAAVLYAEELPNVFPLFLAKLVERHEELESLAMPDVEVLTVPGGKFENEALYMVAFKSPEDRQTFFAALKKEDIPCLVPDDGLRIGLFHTDMLIFLMMAAIGL